jgi:hypothetical protein
MGAMKALDLCPWAVAAARIWPSGWLVFESAQEHQEYIERRRSA